MKYLTLLAAALLLCGCTSTASPPPADGAEHGHPQRLVVLVQASDIFFWDGWEASQADLSNLVHEYHPQSVLLTAQKGTVVQFGDLLKLRAAIVAAGVNDVQIGSGGITGG
jgi:biopolymer transport protein ExbD